MAKRNLKDLMASRTPLGARETVQPTNLYDVPSSPAAEENQATSLPANQQASKPADQETSEPATGTRHGRGAEEAIGATSQQVGLPAKKQTSKPVKKFASYLREDSIKALKMVALQEDKNDYEVLQEAVDAYLERKRS
jgi:hypothetical protein